MQLFVERVPGTNNRRSRSTRDNASVVAAIVRRLDGIPLALELAAARLRSMSVAEIADRLDQRFRLLTTGGTHRGARQQTLRGAIDWSYGLLNAPSATVLCRASVFVGGFDLARPKPSSRTATIIDRFDVIDLVDRLVDKSLIQHDPTHTDGRHDEPVPTARVDPRLRRRQLARGRAGGRRRSAAPTSRTTDAAEAGAAHLSGPDQELGHRLAVDHDNLVAALWTAVELPDCAGLGRRCENARCVPVVVDGLRSADARAAPRTLQA